jgi:hypothetical protein
MTGLMTPAIITASDIACTGPEDTGVCKLGSCGVERIAEV